MDKKGSLLQQKAKVEKESRQYKSQVKILLNKQRDAERTVRNQRLIVHGAIVEGVFPFSASMEGEAEQSFFFAYTGAIHEFLDIAHKASNTGFCSLMGAVVAFSGKIAYSGSQAETQGIFGGETNCFSLCGP